MADTIRTGERVMLQFSARNLQNLAFLFVAGSYDIILTMLVPTLFGETNFLRHSSNFILKMELKKKQGNIFPTIESLRCFVGKIEIKLGAGYKPYNVLPSPRTHRSASPVYALP